MARAKRPVPFHQIDVKRAIRAAQSAGLPVTRTEIGPDGSIVIFHGDVGPSAPATPFDAWKARHAI